MRCFAALELPAAVRAALAGAVPEHEALRRLDADSLHVTLAFLGPQPDEAAPALAVALRTAVRPVGSLSVEGAVWLPRRRPGVLAVRLAGPGTAELQAAVAVALSPWYEPEKRPFLPHVTIARVRRGAALRFEAVRVELPPLEPIVPPAVTLYRSHLGRGGARYEALERVAL